MCCSGMIVEQNIQWGKESFFNKWCWENQITMCKRMKLDPSLTPHPEINSKWLKIRPETINSQEITQRISSLTFILEIHFLKFDPKANATQAKINKWDNIQLKIFRTARETINKMKRQPVEWEKIFASHISEKGFIYKIHRKVK